MFSSKIKKHVYPCKPQFYYIKVGCKGLYNTRTCLHDVMFRRPSSSVNLFQISSLKPLGQSKSKFMEAFLEKGYKGLYKWYMSHDQDGRHAIYGGNL